MLLALDSSLIIYLYSSCCRNSLDVVRNCSCSVEELLNESLIISLAESVGPNCGSRQLYVVLFRSLRNESEVLDLASVLIPLAILDSSEECVDCCAKTLHSRCNCHAFAISSVDRSSLVYVNADDLAANLCSSLSSRAVDSTSASEYDFCACAIPCVHSSCDVSIAEELSAIDILDLYVGESELGSSSICALNESMSVSLYSRYSHSAEESELCEAHLDCSVASHVAGILFLIYSAVYV